MMTTLLVFEQTGKVNGTFAITPAVSYNRENSKKRNRERILEIFRFDQEVNMHGKYIPDENPSKDISTIKFYYNPSMEKQAKYKNLPYQLTSTIQVIDVFTCLGSRFGLDSLNVIVEICESNCSGDRIWANIYYVADSEIPSSIIKVKEYSMRLEDCHIN